LVFSAAYLHIGFTLVQLLGTYNYQPSTAANQRRMFVWRVNATALTQVRTIDLSGLNTLYRDFYDTYMENQRYGWTASWYNDLANVRDLNDWYALWSTIIVFKFT
jgi:hypothetical protein